MAEGGYDAEMEDPLLGHEEDNDDDEEEEVNRTYPFEGPGATSTPYRGEGTHGIEMRTTQHEESGLPQTSYDETSSSFKGFGKPGDMVSRLRDSFFGFVRETEPSAPTAVINFVKKRYPHASDALL